MRRLNYDELAELSRDELVQMVLDAEETLEFYANRENWCFSYAFGGENGGRRYRIYREFRPDDVYGFLRDGVSISYAGMKARRTLYELRRKVFNENELLQCDGSSSLEDGLGQVRH